MEPVKTTPSRQEILEQHIFQLRACMRCPRMQKPVVVGRAILSPILLVGQAPGAKEPVLGRPFAWTAGKTLFGWFERSLGWTEDETRSRIYFAAVCRCFPGKTSSADRVPSPLEVANCSRWLDAEMDILQPRLILPVGKCAISLFLPPAALVAQIGRAFQVRASNGRIVDVIPLPHPSGASPWHRMEPGKTLLALAMERIHDCVAAISPPIAARSPSPSGRG